MIKVLALGCFDLFHYGHLAYLQQAKTLGDKLIVSVTRDQFVNKGTGRPLFPHAERVAIVRELRCVNKVVAHDYAEEVIRRIKPDIYVKGKEYEGRLPEQELVESFGGKVVFLDTPVYSSTDIMTGAMLIRKQLLIVYQRTKNRA